MVSPSCRANNVYRTARYKWHSLYGVTYPWCVRATLPSHRNGPRDSLPLFPRASRFPIRWRTENWSKVFSGCAVATHWNRERWIVLQCYSLRSHWGAKFNFSFRLVTFKECYPQIYKSATHKFAKINKKHYLFKNIFNKLCHDDRVRHFYINPYFYHLY